MFLPVWLRQTHLIALIDIPKAIINSFFKFCILSDNRSTGNDFSRATGWGASVPSGFVRKNREVLRAWLVEILLGDIFNFDLWSVKIELDEELGRFNQVKGNSVVCLQQKALGNDGETLVDQNVTVLSKMCCNYFSTGVESRITFGFEKKRTSSQTMNKFFYGAESLKKMFFKKHGRINDYVKNITYENDGRMVVMDPKKSFLSNPISLIFQNIPSMASGCDFWAGSYKNADKEVTVGNEMVMTRSTDNLLNTTQEVGDGKIELLTIKSLANYSKAKAGQLRGVAKRVTQARGPFLIEFEPDYTDKIYFQIDGESYSCVHPTSFALKYSRSYRILVKRGSHLAMTSTQSKISEASFQERNGKQYTKRTLSVSKPGTPRSGSPRNDPNLDLQKTAFTPLVRAASFGATASGGVSASNKPSTTGLGLGRGLGLGDRLSIRIDKVMHLPPLITNRRNSDTDNIPAATSP